MHQLQPIQEIDAEPPLFNQRHQRRVTRGNDSRVGAFLSLAAERPVLLVLQKPQQRHLRFGREGIDLIEKQRARMSE